MTQQQSALSHGALNDVKLIVQSIMSWSTCTLEVFVRREHGERYLNIGRVIMGWLTIRFCLWLANLQHTFSWIPGVPAVGEATINGWFLTCYLVLSALHILRIWQRNFAGVPYHSYSFGISWLDFLTYLPPLRIGRYHLRITEWMLYRFMEPAICFSLALFLMPISFTRSWLLWASVAMLLHNNMVYAARRTRFLDMLDSHIESGYYNDLRSEALGQQSGKRHVGYVEMPLPPVPLSQEAGDADIAATVAETMGTGEITKQLSMDSVLNTREKN